MPPRDISLLFIVGYLSKLDFRIYKYTQFEEESSGTYSVRESRKKVALLDFAASFNSLIPG
jgi:hypothetical protein